MKHQGRNTNKYTIGFCYIYVFLSGHIFDVEAQILQTTSEDKKTTFQEIISNKICEY